MNLWNVRHQGSPQSVDGLTADDIIDGVKEGIWETSDEVLGPDDTDWVPLERHPVFAAAMAEYEPPPPKHYEDETRLDMNPLIDVALVLLIFFMLTTTYDELRKEAMPPSGEPTKQEGPKTDSELRKMTIRVSARMEGDQPVYRVEDEVVTERDLEAKFKQYRERLGHDRLAMDVEGDVPWKYVLAIQDAAAGAKFAEIIRVVRP